MAENPFNVGIIGLGTVGLGVIDLLNKNKKLIAHRVGREVRISGICAKNKNKRRDRDLSEFRWVGDPLSFSNDKGTKIGNPNVKGASVSATILVHARDKKILIYKKKRRKGYQRKNGHRQWYSEIEISDIKVSTIKKGNTKTKTKVTTKTKTSNKEVKKVKE